MKRIYNNLFRHKKSSKVGSSDLESDYQQILKDELIQFKKSFEMGDDVSINQIGYFYQYGIGVEKDEFKAFIHYQRSAELGNSDGMNNVGYCYFEGIGVEMDKHEAFIYYKKSAEMGNANGLNNVGYCYDEGIGVGKDKHQAFLNYKKSAELGNASAINSLGYFYENGIGVKKNEHQAFINYQQSAEMGNAVAMNNLGDCYRHGIGVKKNNHKAFISYRKSGKMKNADGLCNLGYCYQHGIGVERNEHKAFVNYQKSVEMGNAAAINQIGYCYQHGIGTEKDELKAFNNYKKSAELGNATAINQMGFCYRHGIGVKKNEDKAFDYYQMSARLGNVNGIYNLANCYLYGIGVEKDDHKAFFYYQMSAEMGDSSGMYQVGYCYQNGIGISKDEQQADYWYQMEKNTMLATGEWACENFSIEEVKKLFIEEFSLPWISYDEFTDIKEIGQGGFATVFYAKWFDKKQNRQKDVALKLLHGSRSYNEESVKELRTYCNIISKHPSFLKYHGISKNDSSENYILVLEYATMGSLRKNLNYIVKMDWKEKLTLLRYIANDLQIIHSQGLIHRNLHSGNILQNNLHDAYIADLGLSIPLNGESHGVYGILPYIAPEILNGVQYTTASDIYSFGIILWEILYGNSISYNQAFGTELQIKICHNNLRPTIIKDSPQCYIDLMNQCWDKDPTKRPSAKKLCETFIKWKSDENILLELTKSDILKEFNKTNIQIYPDNVYKSKFINYTTSYYQEDSEMDLEEWHKI